MKAHHEKIKEAVMSLNREVRPREIMDWIKEHYPDENVNEESYRADVIGCSINHPSTHHYPNMPKFLWFNENSKAYRLATKDEVESLEKKQPSKEQEIAVKYYSGMPIIEVGSSGRLVIPSVVMKEMGFVAGDSVAITKNEKGEVLMKKGKLEFKLSS
jgi:hypothetical protein